MNGREVLSLSKRHLELLRILREWTNGNTDRSMAFETILKRWPDCPDREGLVGVARDLEAAGLVELLRPYAKFPRLPGVRPPDIAIGINLTPAGIVELLKAHPADMERGDGPPGKDRRQAEEAETGISQGAPKQAVAKRWEEICIEVISNDDISLRGSGCGTARKLHYVEAGCKDNRTGRPVRAWEVLLSLAEHGEISWGASGDVPQRSVSKAIEVLRKRLRELTGLGGDPFKSYRKEKAWRPRFSLQDRRYGGTGAATARAEGRI